MTQTQIERLTTARFALRLEEVLEFLPLPVRYACQRTVDGQNSQADDDLIDAWVESLDDDE